MNTSKNGQKVYTFPRGGISFSDNSAPNENSCVTSFLSPWSIIPLKQHTGERASPVVPVGELVKEGSLLARGKGAGSANIHATVPGRLVRMVSYKDSGGKLNDAFVIRMEGSFEKLGKREEVFPWDGMLPYDIQRAIADFGVVEMDGSGKPVSDIISSFRSKPQPVTLVVRCVFDQPWLAADYALCKERVAAIAEGAVITSRTCRVSRIIYAVSHGESAIAQGLMEAGSKWGIPSSIVLVGSRYPQRNHRELEIALKAYEKKESIELGSMFVLGPSTLAAVFDAVKKKKPILERYVAVGGNAVRKPQVMKVRIGTMVGDLFDQCGGFSGLPKRVAFGSPLLGRRIYNLDEPVTKTTSAVFALLNEPGQKITTNCINCGECRNVCPVGLDPEEFYKEILIDPVAAKAALSKSRIQECHGCGCCEVVCPSGLPLSTVITKGGSGA